MMKDKGKFSAFDLRSIAVSIFMVLFFCGVIFSYYLMLASETRQKIIEHGNFSAATAAKQIDQYLSTGSDVMRLACYTLDKMIRDGRPQQEIVDVLTNRSAAVESIMSGDSIGLYGYINGEYLDGTGWEPNAGFDATHRPWYIEARANIGQVAVVDPYLDEYSNTIMISLAKTLCDGKSVAAMDISLQRLQTITEELSASNESAMEIVLDQQYRVLAHSDKSERGRNYMAEEGTFGRTLVDGLRSADENYFSITFGGVDYIVYTVPVANDWLCLSVFDETAAFSQLKRTLAFTILASLMIIAIARYIMMHYNKKARLAMELDKRARNADAASEAKSAFLSNMSHEIRTPINAILGMNEMVLRESDDQNVIEYSENIRTAGNMLLGLINDILDFSKIEAGKLEILPVEYDISSLLNDLVSMVQLRAESKGLDLSVDFDGRLPSCLYGDGVRIKQVITNILTNAVKYTEKGSVTFSVGFERSEERPDIVILFVSVKDTGIGIKKEDIGKLFSKFERIEEKCNRHVEGTGLGMAITQNLLGMMGTSLHVESEYGRGSNFYFRLVQKVVRWEPMGDYKASSHGLLKEHKAYREKFTAPDACVLVVDDNPMNLMVFRNLLKKTRVQIDMANSGDEGLLLAQGKKYDIIFLDYMMPRKDGIETLHELRAQVGGPNIDTPAVCLTANAISGARERYIAAGFHEYLTKPLDFGKLEDMLMTFLPEEKIQAAGEEDAPAEVPEEIPEVLAPLKGEDWIDLNLGMENNGDAKSYLELLQIFYESMDEKAEEIEGFYAAENLKDYTIKVHALKSSARIIGAKDFGEEAQKLENAGKRGDMGYIRAHHAAFLETYRSFRAPLAGIFASSKTEKEAAEREKPEADEKRMEGVYEEIRAAADEMDCERLDAVFAEMEGYRILEREAELYEKLKDAASKFEYDTILDLLPKA